MSGTSRAVGVGGRLLATFSGLGAVLVPVGICPVCWPALAGALSAIGIGALVARELLPLAAILLLVSLAALAYRARQRRGYGPLLLGTLSAMALLIGRFELGVDAVTYAGVAGLVTGAAWNGWPIASMNGGCGTCPQAPEQEMAIRRRIQEWQVFGESRSLARVAARARTWWPGSAISHVRRAR